MRAARFELAMPNLVGRILSPLPSAARPRPHLRCVLCYFRDVWWLKSSSCFSKSSAVSNFRPHVLHLCFMSASKTAFSSLANARFIFTILTSTFAILNSIQVFQFFDESGRSSYFSFVHLLWVRSRSISLDNLSPGRPRPAGSSSVPCSLRRIVAESFEILLFEGHTGHLIDMAAVAAHDFNPVNTCFYGFGHTFFIDM